MMFYFPIIKKTRRSFDHFTQLVVKQPMTSRFKVKAGNFLLHVNRQMSIGLIMSCGFRKIDCSEVIK